MRQAVRVDKSQGLEPDRFVLKNDGIAMETILPYRFRRRRPRWPARPRRGNVLAPDTQQPHASPL
eukprot:COSAG06_NODE_5113_length_3712_cov_1.732079_4_plen_65_part_00